MDLQFLAIVPILSVLLIAHELGHFFTARWAGIVVEEFGVGLPPRLFGIKRGGIIYSLNAIPFGAFVRMMGEEDPTHPGSFARQPKLVRMGVLAAGSFMNFLLAVVAFSVAFATGVPTIVDETAIRVLTVTENSPGQAAGLQADDLIYSIDGRPAVPLEQFRQITTENGGKSIALEVERGGTRQRVMITPRTNPPKDQGAMGIAIQPHGSVGSKKYSIPESVWMGVQTSGGVILTTLSIPVLLINGVITPEVARPIGLPGMAQAAGQATAASLSSGWWYPVLALTGFISAGLSLANMLPLPALDGGRFLFVIIEAIRGRRISPEREAAVHFVGLVALLALMILISINDLNSPLPDIDWGVR